MGILNFLGKVAKFYFDSKKVSFTPGRPKRTPSSPPPEKGWYRFIENGSESKLYVGKTNDLNRRKKEHIRAGKLDPVKHIFEYKAEPNVPYEQLGQKEYEKNKKIWKSTFK